jgi:hypothetical protein
MLPAERAFGSLRPGSRSPLVVLLVAAMPFLWGDFKTWCFVSKIV